MCLESNCEETSGKPQLRDCVCVVKTDNMRSILTNFSVYSIVNYKHNDVQQISRPYSLRRILKNSWLVLLKNVSIMKDKDKGSSLKETEETVTAECNV